MTHSSIFRPAATAALALALTAAAFEPALAQTPSCAYIGLYADEARSSNTVSFAGGYTEFTMYVFCGPTDRGLFAAEFSIAYPGNVLSADVTTNPLISVSLGDLDTGISVAFAECQNDWIWTHRQRLFLTSGDAARVGIEKNEVAGEYQIATCGLGYPLEPVFFSSQLCLNAEYPPDTAAPLIQGSNPSWPSTVTVTFSEQVLKQCAQNPSSYVIAELDDSSATVPVGEAALLSGGASVTLYTSQPFTAGVQYVVRAPGVRDPWGNAVPHWSTAAFSTADHNPPRLVSASTLFDSLLTVVFNEPVSPATAANPNNYRIYNNGLLVASYPYRAILAEGNRVVLSFAGLNLLPTAVRLTLKVTNVRDLAGNVISSIYNTTLFTIPDTSPPYVAEIQVLGKRLLSVRFNEEVLTASAQIAAYYQIYWRDVPLMTVPVTAAAVQADRKYVQLSLGSDLALEVYYLLRVFNVEDLHGNRIIAANVTTFMWPDTYPPVPLSALALTRSLIKISFDETLNEPTAETAANYRVYKTSNTSSTVPVYGAELQAGGGDVHLNLGALLEYDTGYTIRVSNVKDLKGNAIPSGGATATTAYPDTFPPVLTGVTPISASSIELVFDEALNAPSAVIDSYYTLFETYHPPNAIGIASAAVVGDGSRVRLALATDLVAGKSYTISVKSVADLKGNAIWPNASSLVFIHGDAVPPALVSARADLDTAVLARFSEKLDNVTAENAANYLVFETANPNASIPVAGAALSGDSSNVLISLGVSLGTGIAYSLKAAGVADRSGNLVSAGSVVPIARPDSIPPRLSAVAAVTLTYLRVTFDEPVSVATAGSRTNYLIVPVTNPGASIVPASVELPDSRTAGLYLSANLAPGATYRLQVSRVADLAGNVIAPASEKSFVTAPTPVGPGYVGLFADAYHASNEIYYTGQFMPFTLYVWYLAGSDGIQAVEFAVSYPDNVIPADYAVNPSAPVWLGDPASDLSVAFSQCQTGWVWIIAQNCFLTNGYQSKLGLGAGPLIANCSAGYPIETARIIDGLYCNGGIGIATLLQESAASCSGGAVEVSWRLSRKDEGVRFTVLRREEGAGVYGAPSDDVEEDGLSFIYRDESAEPGTTYRYRVDYADDAGTRVLFETDPVVVPARPLALDQNWPNPFNPSTTISYYLPDAVRVRLEIFDVAGHRIACLVDGTEERGNHSAVWRGTGEFGKPAATGIYVCRLTAGRETLSRKMVLVR